MNLNISFCWLIIHTVVEKETHQCNYLYFVFIKPWLASKLKVHDTCGVNNLHGMPGILAGVVGILMSGFASEVQYGYRLVWNLYNLFIYLDLKVFSA